MKTMNKKIIKAILGTCLFVFIAGGALADSNTGDNHAALIKKYQDAINQSYNEHQTETNNQIAQAQQQAQDQAESVAKSDTAGDNSSSSTSPATTKQTQPISCDCYDTSSSYNYPANFYYNSKHIRIKRIQPACVCKKHGSEKLSQTSDNQSITTSSGMNMNALADSSTNNNSNDNDIDTTNNNDTNNSNANNQENNNDNFGITYN